MKEFDLSEDFDIGSSVDIPEGVNALERQGMRWDAAKKRWWTGKKSTADSVSEGVLEDTVPGSWEFYLEHQPDLDLEALKETP